MATTGTATLDFGSASASNQEASVAVTGQAGILSTSDAEAYFMAESTSDNDADAHMIAAKLCKLVVGSLVAGTGFTITALNDGELTGTFKVRWVWN